jgi:hypothetical protein
LNRYRMPSPWPRRQPLLRGGIKNGRPGDRYNAKADWRDILEPHDWRIQSTRGDTTYWTKPLARRGEVHATTGYKGVDVLHVFSTDAQPFTAGECYNKFAAFTLLNFGGDFRKAARAIAHDYNPNPLETNDQREEEDEDTQ